MIRKTLYMCALVISSALLALNACGSTTQAHHETLNSHVNEQALKHAHEQKSIWDTELADASRFTLNIKLSAKETKIAKKFARTITKNLKQNEVYVHYLLTKFKENDLPLELAAIPLLESGLEPYAVSHTGAHGPWQYIRSTGRSLGLHKTENYDGIYDFFASTDAGVEYLKKLYADLGNWEFVALAYNQGEYGVKKAISSAKKSGILDPKVSDLKTTRYGQTYVMRFKAFADVLKNPNKYGVSLPKIVNRPAFKRVEVAGRLDSLEEAARLSGAQLKILKKLNSGYTGDKIDGKHGLKMPIEHAATLEKAIENRNAVASNKSTQALKL